MLSALDPLWRTRPSYPTAPLAPSPWAGGIFGPLAPPPQAGAFTGGPLDPGPPSLADVRYPPSPSLADVLRYLPPPSPPRVPAPEVKRKVYRSRT
jgi:hypothetical protein